MKRRSLFGLFATATFAPAAFTAAALAVPKSGRVLVLLELRGGNDGLNTVAPYRDPIYLQARPRLALEQPLPLSDGLGLHPSMVAIEPLWREGRLSFALGLGWPMPNRSHFKAMDQWATGKASAEGPGWLAAAMDQRLMAGPLVALGPAGSSSTEGGKAMALQVAAEALKKQNSAQLNPQLAAANPVLRRMLELELAGARELERLREGLQPSIAGLSIPKTALGQQVDIALRLIASPNCPPVITLAQGGYDTHANQASAHANQLKQLADALQVFDRGLKQLTKRPQVTLLAVSEFGRRLRENSSNGTDHGSASIGLIYGDFVGRNLPHPFIGKYPSLDQLDQRGDLIANLSPDQLYRQVLNSLWV